MRVEREREARETNNAELGRLARCALCHPSLVSPTSVRWRLLTRPAWSWPLFPLLQSRPSPPSPAPPTAPARLFVPRPALQSDEPHSHSHNHVATKCHWLRRSRRCAY